MVKWLLAKLETPMRTCYRIDWSNQLLERV